MAKAAVFSGSKRSLGITEGVSRVFPQVLLTEKETSRERKRTDCSCQRNGKTSALHNQEAQIV